MILAGTGNQVKGNSIHDNGGLGIDLDGDGVTANDPLDPDTGANLLQNFPTLTSAVVAGGVSVAGSISSTPNTALTIAVVRQCGLRRVGLRRRASFVGAVNVTTAANGNGAFAATFPATPGGFWLTATASDPAGNTSEFGPCRRAELLSGLQRQRPGGHAGHYAGRVPLEQPGRVQRVSTTSRRPLAAPLTRWISAQWPGSGT